jgi:hypothetical protein
MSDRSKLRGQTKGVSISSGFGGRLVSPHPVKMCSPRNLIQGLGLDGTVGNDLKHGNWIMILAHGTYDHSIKLGFYNPYYMKRRSINWNSQQYKKQDG